MTPEEMKPRFTVREDWYPGHPWDEVEGHAVACAPECPYGWCSQ